MLFGKLRSSPLLSFEEVQAALQSRSYSFKGLQTIALDSVIGSEGRWRDFSRDFLPLPRHRERMLQLQKAGEDVLRRPIEVFQVGEAYFIRDGHHRTALARQRGDSHIPALVTEIVTHALITPGLEPNEVLNQARLSHFLASTRLDQHVPMADFSLGQGTLYDTLLQHIHVHRYYLGLDYGREFSLQEAAASWHDLIYCPVLQALQDAGAPREFPRRTSAELYLWLTHHREQYRCAGEKPTDREVANRLVERFSERPVLSGWKRLKRALQAAWLAIQERPEPPRDSAMSTSL